MRNHNPTVSLLLTLLPGVVCSRACADSPDDYVPPPHTLARAASDGNLPLVKKMLAQTPALLNKPVEHWPPISFAAMNGKENVVRYMLEKGAKPNSEDPAFSPLSRAAIAKNKTIIDMLLAKGADPKQGFPLFYVAGDTALFHYLAKKGANIHALAWGSIPLLEETVEELNIDNARLLLEQNVDVNKGQNGYSPLHSLAFLTSKPLDKTLALARLLLDKGADPNRADNLRRRTALSEAVFQKFPAMVRLLLAYDSPVRCSEATISAARKDLHLAASGDKTIQRDANDPENKPLTKKDIGALQEIADLLHEPLTNLPVLEETQAVSTTLLPADPLFLAAYNGDLKAVQKLARSGKSLKAKDKDGRTPLHYAALGGRLDVTKWLFANRVELNARDAKGATPLALARQDTQDAKLAERRAETIAFLTDKGAAE